MNDMLQTTPFFLAKINETCVFYQRVYHVNIDSLVFYYLVCQRNYFSRIKALFNWHEISIFYYECVQCMSPYNGDLSFNWDIHTYIIV